MWGLIASLASSASGLITLLAVVAGLIGIGAFEQHRIDANQVSKLKLEYAQAQAAAIAQAAATQKQVDQFAQDAVDKETAAQTALTTLHREKFDAPIIKTIAADCLPYGFIRLHNAAASLTGNLPVTLPAGKSDDACAPVSWLTVERTIADNYYTAQANAEQLNRLIDVLKQEQKAVSK